ncbi:stage II sporulation protein P [Neobacillus terrae]|uniref:stage II sporulation protein P n=1 Tax=Neobacillus terrae TaxID=3034837 RepID=UPI0014087700|nr:stage II sporulation protein P [Neobacillus terrae]NHM30970.1 stage II sporulation protein P [Neobacillus terrae]
MNFFKNILLKYTIQSMLLVSFIFLTIFIVVLMDIKITSQSLNNSIGIFNTEKLFVELIKSENHAFFPEAGDSMFNSSRISNIFFQLLATIKPTDVRTFLGNELPGLMQYNTEVVIAGEGTNLTNLPYESSPPTEVLLNEKKVAEDQLNQNPLSEAPVSNPDHKSVFIYHTHSWEAFLPLLKDAKEPDDAISSDKRVSVVGLGARLANDLMKNKIGVLHDETNMTQELRSKGLKPTQAYSESRKIVQEAAARNHVLKYYIDIHRDSARGNVTTKTINGVNYARLYFVIGKENKNYLDNLEMAKTLNQNLEKKFPGISRGVFLKTYSEGNGVYNQDISNKAILLEIGGVDNNLAELNRTVDAFSEILTDYYWKSNEAKEVNGNR